LIPLFRKVRAHIGAISFHSSGERPKPICPPPEPTDGTREAEEDDDEGGCEGQATETEDDALGAGSSWEAARAANVYLRGPARLPRPPLPQNRPVIRPQGRM
jgi:hypothetical protein